MRKKPSKLISLILPFLTILNGCNLTTSQNYINRKGGIPKVESLEDIARIVEKISWSDKNVNTIESPEETVSLGYGECKDFTNLSLYLLEKLNKESYAVILVGNKENRDGRKRGHVFSIFREGELYGAFNNQKYISAKKLNEILELEIYKECLGEELNIHIVPAETFYALRDKKITLQKILNPNQRTTQIITKVNPE